VPAGSAVQDQRAVAGVGNIYASEGLFLAGVDPRRPAENVADDEWDRLWDALQPMMWDGTTRYGRTITVSPEGQARGETRYVYQRKGKPCLVCQTPVEKVALPPFERAAYLCPVCQS
jgi:formamidopyrimidine-DNA glycosylase